MKLTNANFAKKDQNFRVACEVASVLPTKRQASKYRRRLGRAVKVTMAQINQHKINKMWDGDTND
uniref:Uncharacterized protein n=1 Tax=viral metagenome TaxID=1070528 RepID=A0A6M3JP82_9ZZZZ